MTPLFEQPGEVTGLAERDEPTERNATKLGLEVDLHARHHRRSQGHEMILEDLNLVALRPTPPSGDDQ